MTTDTDCPIVFPVVRPWFLLVLVFLFSLMLPFPFSTSNAGVQQAKQYMEQGVEAFRRQDLARAEQLFLAATRDEPANATAHKWLGMAFAAREAYKEALAPFRRACELDPDEVNACYYLGRTLYTLNRFEEAREVFELTLKQHQPLGKPLLGLALTLEAVGMPAEAERRYREAIDQDEKRALIDYGLFLYKNGRGQESIEVLRKADAPEELKMVTRAVSAAKAPGRTPLAIQPVRFDPSPLGMVVRNGAAGDKHLIETMIAGVALLDFDRDGRLDVFVANGGAMPSLEKVDPSYSNKLFRNAGNGQFYDVTERAGVGGKGYCMGVATADYDNDGWTDLLVTGVRGNRLYHNQGDGAFADVTEEAGLGNNGPWSVAAGWLDFDNDGRLDLFVVNYVQWDPATEIFCGSYQSGYRSYCHPKYYKPLPSTLYRNLGNGKFRDVSSESGIADHPGKGMGLAFSDIDMDGRMDVFVANDTVPNFLFHNEGNGKFREVALEAGVAFNNNGVATSSMGADFRDIDNDGLEDLFVTAITNETFPLFRNLGGGLFMDVAGPARVAGASLPWSGWSNGVYDFNNDGWKDLFSANGHAVDNVDLITSSKARQPNTVFMNRGDGTFQIATLAGEALHRGTAFGDIDGDGRIDVVVTRLNEAPIVLRNVTEGSGNWIRFRLHGSRSNRDGIGAVVEIETDAGKQWNRVTTCVGYGGSSETAVHFGIGSENRVGRARIRWPSGAIQMLADLEGRRQHEVTEPK